MDEDRIIKEIKEALDVRVRAFKEYFDERLNRIDENRKEDRGVILEAISKLNDTIIRERTAS